MHQPSIDRLSNLPVNPAMIGRRLGAGFEHVVYEFGNKKVIKIPRLFLEKRYPDLCSAEKKDHVINIITKKFGNYALPTEVIESRDGRSYAMVQDRVEAFFAFSGKAPVATYKDTALILSKNRELEAETGLSLELVGLHGLVKFGLHKLSAGVVLPILSNLVVVNDGDNPSVRILDMSLVEVPGTHASTSQIGGIVFNANKQVIDSCFAHLT